MNRYSIILLVSVGLSACTTVNETVTTSEPVVSESVNQQALSQQQPPTVVSQSELQNQSSLSRYLRDYLAKNIGHRARTSRSLIDRSNIEGNGRLPSKSLFQSLGYRVRDAFVAVPPELSSRKFRNPETTLYARLITDLETTWALLDSTRARLKSKGGLEAGRQDWEVAVTRRNLLLEAISYWYQMRNQANHSDWLTRLGDQSNALYQEISQARQNYDVQDLREHEFVLLNLRADVAALFQFYSSEQARLYNRIGNRVLPSRMESEQPHFTQQIRCSADEVAQEEGLDYLNRYYPKRLDTILSSNHKAAVYELNKLAREISAQALQSHADRLKVIEQKYVVEHAQAMQQRAQQIDKLEQRQLALAEIGQEFDPNELQQLKDAPLGVTRAVSNPNEIEQLLYGAITVLAEKTADKLLDINQQRLSVLLLSTGQIYQDAQDQLLFNATDEMKVLHHLLLDIYHFSFVDYLLGYERLSFINNAMLNDCGLSDEINSRVIGFDPQSIETLANLVESHHGAGFAKNGLQNQLNDYQRVVNAFAGKAIGQGYRVPAYIDPESGVIASSFEYNSLQGEAILVTAKEQEYDRINKRFVEQGLTLASRTDVFKFANGLGYSLQIAETESVSEAADLIKRYAADGNGIIYRSKQSDSNRVLLKVLIGQEASYDDILVFQKQTQQGLIKPFVEIRNEVYDD